MKAKQDIYIFFNKDFHKSRNFFSIETSAKKIYIVESLNSICWTSGNNCIRVGSNRFNIITIDYKRVTDLYCARYAYIIYSYIIKAKIGKSKNAIM